MLHREVMRRECRKREGVGDVWHAAIFERCFAAGRMDRTDTGNGLALALCIQLAGTWLSVLVRWKGFSVEFAGCRFFFYTCMERYRQPYDGRDERRYHEAFRSEIKSSAEAKIPEMYHHLLVYCFL